MVSLRRGGGGDCDLGVWTGSADRRRSERGALASARNTDVRWKPCDVPTTETARGLQSL